MFLTKKKRKETKNESDEQNHVSIGRFCFDLFSAFFYMLYIWKLNKNKRCHDFERSVGVGSQQIKILYAFWSHNT